MAKKSHDLKIAGLVELSGEALLATNGGRGSLARPPQPTPSPAPLPWWASLVRFGR